eukprot:5200074-Karenia_brevis.AAC.1
MDFIPHAAQMGGLSALEQRVLQPATMVDYNMRLNELEMWMAPLTLMSVTAQHLDLIVCDFFDQMYFMGKTYGDGTKLLAAIKHARPEFGRHGH